MIHYENLIYGSTTTQGPFQSPFKRPSPQSTPKNHHTTYTHPHHPQQTTMYIDPSAAPRHLRTTITEGEHLAAQLAVLARNLIFALVGGVGVIFLLVVAVLWVSNRVRDRGVRGLFTDHVVLVPPGGSMHWRGLPNVLGERMRMFERGEMMEGVPERPDSLVARGGGGGLGGVEGVMGGFRVE